MHLRPEDLAKLESIAMEAATRAGGMIQTRSAQDHDILRKEGGSSLASQVVTAVDHESEHLILDTLAATFSEYDLGLLTEERPDDSSRHEKDHFWCIDPLDGTLSFTRGLPGYSVSLALVDRAGNPLIGVVCDPSSGTLFHAVHRQGARKNGQPWPEIERSQDAPLTLVIDDSFRKRANDPIFREKLDSLAARNGCQGVRIIDRAGAVLNACSVLSHAPSLYFKFPKATRGGGSSWDYAATTCLFRELGRPHGDFSGRPLQLNPPGETFMNHCGILFASDPDLAAAVACLPLQEQTT